MTRKKPQGFGPQDQGGFIPHPCSLDAAALQLARIGAVRVTSTDSLDALPKGTILWTHFVNYLEVTVEAVDEDWLIKLTLCDCCPTIRGWTVKHYVDDKSGSFFQFDMDAWEGIEKAIETARFICTKYATTTA